MPKTTDYARLKKLKKHCIKNFEERDKKINQPIVIRDIFIYPLAHQHSFGESTISHDNIYSQYPLISRLIDHIDSLAKIGNEYHQQYNCNEEKIGAFRLKKECLNKVTRVLLNEFSLYTEKPLSLNSFSLLMRAVYKIAQQQQDNVHLLLSSFSVVTGDQKLLNMSAYVQCGEEPRIETFCKSHASHVDIQYKNTVLFEQKACVRGPTTMSPYVCSEKDILISNNTVFSVRTKGGAEYLQAIDICLDHFAEHSKSLLKQLIHCPVSASTNIIPNCIDHILTSNSILPKEDAKLSESFVQIDPRESIVCHLKNDKVTESDLNIILKEKYHKMFVKKSTDFFLEANGFLVNKPSFGSSYKIFAAEERQLGGFSNDFKRMVNDTNLNIKKQVVEAKIEQQKGGGDYNRLIDQNSDKADKIENLYQGLRDKCRPNFLESSASVNYKLAAKNRITDSLRALQALDKCSDSYVSNADHLLVTLKNQLAFIDRQAENPLFKDFISKADSTTVEEVKTAFSYSAL